jgi:hypothetical protein
MSALLKSLLDLSVSQGGVQLQKQGRRPRHVGRCSAGTAKPPVRGQAGGILIF